MSLNVCTIEGTRPTRLAYASRSDSHELDQGTFTPRSRGADGFAGKGEAEDVGLLNVTVTVAAPILPDLSVATARIVC